MFHARRSLVVVVHFGFWIVGMVNGVRSQILVAAIYVYAPLERLPSGGLELEVLVEAGEHALNCNGALGLRIMVNIVWIELLDLAGA